MQRDTKRLGKIAIFFLYKRFTFICICLILTLGACKNKSPFQDLIGEDANWSKQGEFQEKVSTYEDDNRHIWQKPDRVIGLLGDIENKTIADIGAGTGYFAFRLVPKAQKVIAVDIDQRFIDFMNRRKELLPESQKAKFEVRMATPMDPMLENNEVDAVLMVNTYAYIDNRIEYIRNLQSKLKVGGKILIIDFKMKSIPNGPEEEDKVALSKVERELKEAGFHNIKTDDTTLDYQYIVSAMEE